MKQIVSWEQMFPKFFKKAQWKQKPQQTQISSLGNENKVHFFSDDS